MTNTAPSKLIGCTIFVMMMNLAHSPPPPPPPPPTTTLLKRCDGWCNDHPSAWSVKCAWTTNACSGCSSCNCDFDCNVGYNDFEPLQWAKGWSKAKQTYCCKTAQKSCPSELPPPSGPDPSQGGSTFHYDCSAGYHKDSECLQKQWSLEKLEYCKCEFDCNAGYKDLGRHQWVKGWSGEKKLYCCKTARKGCPSELPPPSGLPPKGRSPEPDTFQYDCNAGYRHYSECLERQWSPQKLEYCCRFEHKGCKWGAPERDVRDF